MQIKFSDIRYARVLHAFPCKYYRWRGLIANGDYCFT